MSSEYLSEFFERFDEAGAYFHPENSTPTYSWGDFRTGDSVEQMLQANADMENKWVAEAEKDDYIFRLSCTFDQELRLEIYGSDMELEERAVTEFDSDTNLSDLYGALEGDYSVARKEVGSKP